MNEMEKIGIVISGKGDCQGWSDDLHNLYSKNTLNSLVKGSLNIEPNSDFEIVNPDSCFMWNGKNISLKKCKIKHNKKESIAYIIRNDVDKTHPKNVIELISDINFRKEWKLLDNDEVVISFY